MSAAASSSSRKRPMSPSLDDGVDEQPPVKKVKCDTNSAIYNYLELYLHHKRPAFGRESVSIGVIDIISEYAKGPVENILVWVAGNMYEYGAVPIMGPVFDVKELAIEWCERTNSVQGSCARSYSHRQHPWKPYRRILNPTDSETACIYPSGDVNAP